MDDDANIRGLGAEILREDGYTVLEAADASDAIRMLEDHPTVGLLFTDISMPGLCGYVLADMAVTRWPHLRVLYTTALLKTAVIDTQRGSFHGEMLVKPYSAARLTAAIAGSLARARPSDTGWGDTQRRK
ncbi:MAG TPA: response regulator [Stellaceae bacterium]|nr:response regulator [Stellaceae bacterium]